MANRICVTVLDPHRSGTEVLKTPMDERFGRAAGFVIIDGETGDVLKTIENTAAIETQGAGTAAAALMKDHEINQVISGRFGPKAFQALNALGIQPLVAPAGISVEQALKKLSDGHLDVMRVREFR